jgi:hypothetical protein
MARRQRTENIMKFLLTKFESAYEMANYIRREHRKEGHAAVFVEPSFCRDSLETALGNLDGTIPFKTKTLDMADEITEKLRALDDGKNANIPDVVFDVTGQECDLDRYLTGEPENMKYFEASTAKRLLNIVLCTDINADISQTSIMARGAAFVAMIDRLLESNKFILNVNVCSFAQYNGDVFTYMINFDLSKTISRNALAYLATAPSVTRRLFFALLEITCKQDNCGSYGHARPFSTLLSAIQQSSKPEQVIELFGEANGRIVYDTLSRNTTESQELERVKETIEQYKNQAVSIAD